MSSSAEFVDTFAPPNCKANNTRYRTIERTFANELGVISALAFRLWCRCDASSSAHTLSLAQPRSQPHANQPQPVPTIQCRPTPLKNTACKLHDPTHASQLKCQKRCQLRGTTYHRATGCKQEARHPTPVRTDHTPPKCRSQHPASEHKLTR
jgi:hypothetical protein